MEFGLQVHSGWKKTEKTESQYRCNIHRCGFRCKTGSISTPSWEFVLEKTQKDIRQIGGSIKPHFQECFIEEALMRGCIQDKRFCHFWVWFWCTYQPLVLSVCCTNSNSEYLKISPKKLDKSTCQCQSDQNKDMIEELRTKYVFATQVHVCSITMTF